MFLFAWFPKAWKTSLIVPIPKNPKPQVLNDHRPVALTSIIGKSLEKLILGELLKEAAHAQDKLQFAYRDGRGTDDAILFMMHKIYCHLDQPKGKRYVRILFGTFHLHLIQCRHTY